MPDAVSSSPALTLQPSTASEAIQEGQPIEEASRARSNQRDLIPDEKGSTGGEKSADLPAHRQAETRYAKDVDADMDLGQGPLDPVPHESPGSDPVSSANKPKPKSAFIKIMELGEKDMLIAYLEAFFGKSYEVWDRFAPLYCWDLLADGGQFGK